jgi:hypothetical protein
MEDKIKMWLELFSIEDILEQSDITEERVLEILLEDGYIVFPPWMMEDPYATDDEGFLGPLDDEEEA